MQLLGDLSNSLPATDLPAWWSKTSARAQQQQQSFWRWPDTVPLHASCRPWLPLQRSVYHELHQLNTCAVLMRAGHRSN